MLLHTILFGFWTPPEVKEVRRHTILGSGKKANKEPVQARSKIMAVLSETDWMTNKQIAELTALQLNTVQTTTNKLFTKGKIERKTKKEKSDIKPICLYRKK
jgi:predicted transcriptional regulator